MSEERKIFICENYKDHIEPGYWVKNTVSRLFFDKRIIFCAICIKEDGSFSGLLKELAGCCKAYEDGLKEPPLSIYARNLIRHLMEGIERDKAIMKQVIKDRKASIQAIEQKIEFIKKEDRKGRY